MQPNSLLELAQAIVGSESKVVLVGGLAVLFHGAHSPTYDFDLAISGEDEDANLSDFFRRLDAKPNFWKSSQPFEFDGKLRSLPFMHLQSRIGPIDLLFRTPPVPFRQLWDNAVLISVEGVDLRVASLDDLIAIKSAAGRDKDKVHLGLLQKLKELKENP